MAYLGSGAAPTATATGPDSVSTSSIQDSAVTAGKMASTLDLSSKTVTLPASAVPTFAAGTLMLFQQTAAPTGWTKQTTHNDKALRVVSGTASSGGSVGFTTAFASGLSAGATTLTTAQIPSHNHYSGLVAGTGPQNNPSYATSGGSSGPVNTGSTGGGGSHSHSLPSFAVSYVDLIIAAKD